MESEKAGFGGKAGDGYFGEFERWWDGYGSYSCALSGVEKLQW
jgi:hypothetical protein